MNFDTLRRANVQRCETAFHPLNDWSPTDWACALAGEAGEVCNAVKKLKRGDGGRTEIANEIADTIIYADLLAAALGIDLGEAVRIKFNQVSTRVSSDIRIPSPHAQDPADALKAQRKVLEQLAAAIASDDPGEFCHVITCILNLAHSRFGAPIHPNPNRSQGAGEDQ